MLVFLVNKLIDRMIQKFKLGIFMNQDKLVNHRSLIKIILNPLFRKFGFDIKSIVHYDLIMYNDINIDGILNIKRIDYRIGRDKTNKPLKWDFYGNDMNQYDTWFPTIKTKNLNYIININKGKIYETIS